MCRKITIEIITKSAFVKPDRTAKQVAFNFGWVSSVFCVLTGICQLHRPKSRAMSQSRHLMLKSENIVEATIVLMHNPFTLL